MKRKAPFVLLIAVLAVLVSTGLHGCAESKMDLPSILSATSPAVPGSSAMKTTLNHQVNFSFEKSPTYDRTLWLPGSEVMRLFNYVNIVLDGQSVSCNYFDSENNYKNAYYQAGSHGYSINSDAQEYLQTAQTPFARNGEIFIPESIMEALTGDVFTYDQESAALNISVAEFLELQAGNQNNYRVIITKNPADLNDNRISDLVSSFGTSNWGEDGFRYIANQSQGWKWQSATINNQDWYEDDWSVPDFNMTETYANFYRMLDDNGMKITYNLIFKDKETLGASNREGQGSLNDPAQVERYLQYVEEVVTYFKGIVDSYEIWNEQNIGNSPQYVAVEDYIAVVKKAYPLIKSIDPEAIVSIGHTTSYYEDYSWEYIDALVSSDVVQYADRIAIHPFFWVSPEHYPDYYYNYPEIVTEMKEKAIQNGFKGDFWGSEGNYQVVETVPQDQEYMLHAYTEIEAAKYLQRVNAMNIGLGLSGGVMGTNNNPVSTNAIGRSALLFSGVREASYGIAIHVDAQPLRSYSYDVDMGKLFAYWFDGIAADESPAFYGEIILDLPDCEQAYGYDVLNGYFLELDVEKANHQIILRDMLITDYPIFILVK